MAEPHVVTALVQKRADLAGELAETEIHAKTIRANIDLVDKCLALFGYKPDPQGIPPRRRQRGRIFGRGELSRMVYDILRAATGPITNREIGARIVAIMNWDQENADLISDIAVRVKDARKRMPKT